MKSIRALSVCLTALLPLVTFATDDRVLISHREPPVALRATAQGADVVHRWNQIAIDASGIDHMSAATAEQLGPGRASRARGPDRMPGPPLQRPRPDAQPMG